MRIPKNSQIRRICISGTLFYAPDFSNVRKLFLIALSFLILYAKIPHRSAGFLSASFLSMQVGGDGEIRTLDTLLGYTRFPIVRARPATRHLHIVVRRTRLSHNRTAEIIIASLPPNVKRKVKKFFKFSQGQVLILSLIHISEPTRPY